MNSNWKEVVVVVDSTTTTLPTMTAGKPVLIESEHISDGHLVLFTNVPRPGQYIYNQSTGSFTLWSAVFNGAQTYVWVKGSEASIDLKNFTFKDGRWMSTVVVNEAVQPMLFEPPEVSPPDWAPPPRQSKDLPSAPISYVPPTSSNP